MVKVVCLKWTTALISGLGLERLRDILPSIVMSLDHEAEDQADARATGLHRFVTSFSFVVTLLLLCDILPLINRLSVLFQTSELDFASVGSAVKSTVKSVKAQQAAEGPQLARLDSYIHKLEAADIHITLPKGVCHWSKRCRQGSFQYWH